ncbi:glycoside hydrolase family 32 protein [Atopobiaceae bacterium 24-176]
MNSLTRDLARLCRARTEEAARRGHGPWSQRFHLMPEVGWLNDPNGLCQKDGVFHAYYQSSPFDVDGGLKCWGHATSRDLLSWEPDGVVLVPDTPFDCHGVYSGSAVVHGGRIHAFYTGNVKREEPGREFDYVLDGRESNTVLVESDDGSVFGPKRLVMTVDDYPASVTRHVRDPRVIQNPGEGPAFLMLLGARSKGPDRDHDRGEVLVFGSEDLVRWECLNVVASVDPMGYMWECPDHFTLGRTPATRTDGAMVPVPLAVLSVSPQGMEGPAAGANVYPSGYMGFSGSLLGPCELGEFALWDAGFDFYAPQTFEAEDGRRILIGWMGMADCPQHANPTVEHGWQHCFTLPREVTTDGRAVIQRPVSELASVRGRLWEGQGSLSVEGVALFDLEVDGVCGSRFALSFAGGLDVFYDAAAGEMVMAFRDRSRSSAGGGRGERRLAVPSVESLRVVGDASSVEVFCNRGRQVLSTRYYPREYAVNVEAPGAFVRLWELDVPQSL